MNTPAIAPKIKTKERHAVLQALRAGVVPRLGLQHIQVGRKAEISAILSDLDRVAEGSAAIRFIVGRFGAGKSFFLNLVQTVALEKGFLVMRADVTTDRRFQGSGGQARAMVAELVKNMASRARPDGGALTSVVERWISDVTQELREAGTPEDAIEQAIVQRLRPLHEMVGGFDFAEVVARYYRGYVAGDDALQQAAIRWLRAEYETKTEARQALGVRQIVDDAEMYDHLKLLARFARLAGYAGLVVGFDELVVLSHRLSNRKARDANYEQILRMINDCLQGHVEGLAILYCGTDECLEDRRRGLYSYEALATRLAPNAFAGAAVDLTGPVIRLQNLTVEDLYVLLQRIRHVHAEGDPARYLLPDDGIAAYLQYCSRTLGAEHFLTPRASVTKFVGLLGVLEADANRDWRAALGGADAIAVPANVSAEGERAADDDDLTTFRL